ncbi:pyridoxamine 5'-phosphate oxidase family protein [Streptomyces sp. ME02-6991-2A]|uniref:pyridoxamine 5'-phosphate oxidase family protein n=1 Tax=Streptomyces sp. ME02-6991-2A TaxID=3028677 RepID=UPI0010081190|nr:pyridoxamine 5'-phosphate oxidase family protein [Streptomyces sp. ME02-6991-2A]MDX3377027.1 pyridoxamine 5'-phosphate oxidase family protein [Streptomyces sp. ME02-6991-2A]
MGGYHRGETAVQERAGFARQAGQARGAIGSTVPDVAVAFLADQPHVVLGAADERGRIWATQLTGEPGFLTVPGPHTLRIGVLPPPEDPLAGVLAGAGSGFGAGPLPVGMIGIEPATRRRMRMNGRAVRDRDGLRVELDQVISNCPKYIQKRDHHPAPGGGPPASRTAVDSAELSPAQQRTLRAADTFFVATASDRGDADASHRGGNPGFVQVLSPRLLRWPDYAGNAMFLTLGNLELNPAAGLFVPGWETGTSLHLTGSARTVWDEEEVARTPGAQRLVEFEITAVREVAAASPLRWSAPAYSRFNPPTSG